MFFVFLHYKINGSKGVFWPKIPLNLTSEGLKYPPEVRVQHETCSTICGTHVQAILDQKNLTWLAGGSGWSGWSGGKVVGWSDKSLEIVDNQVRCVLHLHMHTRREPCGKILDVLLSK